MEDNEDVARLIGRQLSPHYAVHYASDGQQGIALARELVPDLIVTDLMMPYADGLTLCRTIRQDGVTGHIPIIVVTARTTEDDRIRGLEAGADAYLYKPFNAAELSVLVRKLMEQRQRLRSKYEAQSAATALQHPKETQPEPTPEQPSMEEQATFSLAEADTPAAQNTPAFVAHSEKFLQDIREVILWLIPHGECDVERLASELCMSSSQLRRKMRAITDISPKKFIRDVQLEQARLLLEKYPDRKLVEVADECGFYDLSHFVRVFRQAFGVTPGDYQRSKSATP